MALKHVMINEIIGEHSIRMQNLKKYYPFFVLCETSFIQFKEGKYQQLDMGYISMASLRFFINENNFNERNITYNEYEQFLVELLRRDFLLEDSEEAYKELAIYIFDKLTNEGKAFEYRFFDPELKTSMIARVRLIESKIIDGQVYYCITSEGIEFYLDTKEIKDESKINVQQLLLEKMITADNFKGGIDVVKRINSEVTKLILQKEKVIKILSVDVFEGAKASEEFMKMTSKWFNDEQKLFAKNKALVDKAIEKAAYEKSDSTGRISKNKVLAEISQLETELKKTIYRHGELMAQAMELSQISDNIISRAKLKKLRPVFDFHQMMNNMIKNDNPQLMENILLPLFAPKLQKSFSIRSIDNILTLKSEDGLKGEVISKEKVDKDFVYQDEILDSKIGNNFAKLFCELLDQIKKWGKINLKEFNAILEIKFGKEVYKNKDYYAFLAHLAGKNQYNMSRLLKKQDTMLEGILVEFLGKEEKIRFKDIEFVIEFDYDELIQLGENESVTNMTFEKRSN